MAFVRTVQSLKQQLDCMHKSEAIGEKRIIVAAHAAGTAMGRHLSGDHTSSYGLCNRQKMLPYMTLLPQVSSCSFTQNQQCQLHQPCTRLVTNMEGNHSTERVNQHNTSSKVRSTHLRIKTYMCCLKKEKPKYVGFNPKANNGGATTSRRLQSP